MPYNYLTFRIREDDRKMIAVRRSSGRMQGFYISTGKNSGQKGTLFPFFGYNSNSAWIVKPRENNIPSHVDKLIRRYIPRFNASRFGCVNNMLISLKFGEGMWQRYPELKEQIAAMYAQRIARLELVVLGEQEKLVVQAPGAGRSEQRRIEKEINGYLRDERCQLIFRRLGLNLAEVWPVIENNLDLKKSLIMLQSVAIAGTIKKSWQALIMEHWQELKSNPFFQKALAAASDYIYAVESEKLDRGLAQLIGLPFSGDPRHLHDHGKEQTAIFVQKILGLPKKEQAFIQAEMTNWSKGYGFWSLSSSWGKLSRVGAVADSGMITQSPTLFYDMTAKERELQRKRIMNFSPDI
ncbi:hypothetical protein [Piscirickettsia salmonis]|uniref:hypothetical protein n=1 Tax=Piscirickettsia salmonis TaxID=1238 RepID=UPI0007C93CC6|nr:hypothetical protein A0O36_02432 [Piscirickettsiaceae bacterium NZ-RLO1]